MSYERQKRMIDGLRARGGERHVLMLQPDQQRGLLAYVEAMGGTITDALNALVAAGLAAEGVKAAPAPKPVEIEPAALAADYAGPKAIVRDGESLWGPCVRLAPLPMTDAPWVAFTKAFKAAPCEFERREVARMALAKSTSLSRTKIEKTRSAELNDAMLDRVVATQIRCFMHDVAEEFGTAEDVEDALNTWLGQIDRRQVFGHLQVVRTAELNEFRKFLRL